MGRRKEQRHAEMQEVCAKMGLALSVLHEIENRFSEAFLFALNERDRKKGKTFNDVCADRDEMTFGRMVSLMKEEWKLHSELEAFLDLFVKERNFFVHRLTKMDGYGLVRKRERQRLAKRVDFFLEFAYAANKIFQSARYASMDFAQDYLKKHKEIDVGLQFPEEIKRDISEFLELIEYIGPNKPIKPTP